MSTVFDPAVQALENELHDLRNRAASVEMLISELCARSGTPPAKAKAPYAGAPVVRSGQKKGGPKVVDPDDKQRAKNREAMRRRRAKLKAQAAEPTKLPEPEIVPPQLKERYSAARPAHAE